MVKARLWVALSATPVVVVSALFAASDVAASAGNRSWFGAKQTLSPERMLSIAQTFEQQGRHAEAKRVYEKIQAQHPNSEIARSLRGRTLPAAQVAVQIPSNTPTNPTVRSKISVMRNAPELAMQAAPIPAKRLSIDPEPELAIEQPHRSKTPLIAELTNIAHDLSSSQNEVATEETVPDQFSSIAPTPIKQIPNIVIRPAEIEKPFDDAAPVVADADPIEQPSKRLEQDSAIESSLTEETITEKKMTESSSESTSLEIQETTNTEVAKVLPKVEKTSPISVSKRARSKESNGATMVRSARLRPLFKLSDDELESTLRTQWQNLKPHLIQVATEPKFHWEDRSLAVYLMGMMGQEATDTLPKLRHSLRNCPDKFLQIDLAQAVLLIHPNDAEAIHVLVGLIHTTKPTASGKVIVVNSEAEVPSSEKLRLRRIVFQTLGAVGPAAIKAVPELELALESSDPTTRELAGNALEKIVSTNSVQTVSLRSKRNRVNRND